MRLGGGRFLVCLIMIEFELRDEGRRGGWNCDVITEHGVQGVGIYQVSDGVITLQFVYES